MIVIILIVLIFVFIGALIFLILHNKYLTLINKKLLLENAEIKQINAEIENKIENILQNFPIPILVLDKKGKIKFANAELKHITDNSTEEHNYFEFFNQPEFIESIHKVQEKKTVIIEELLHKEKIYKVFFWLENNETFIIFKDITDTKEISRIKKEIVSNISHELKTPLTVIKGYLETIYDEVDDKIKKYVEITKNHTERLVRIINDLLKLSELEEEKIEFEKVDIKELIEKIVDMFEKKIKQKGLTLTLEIDKINRYIYGDYYKIEDLIINLLDNAVRYTDKGEIKIKTEKKDTNLIIRIKDTGIGIPEKSLPRVFERFYVVDKSRSRETGGTGLGLAIVKHIVLLHKGTIDIKSSLGQGTEVIVSLPLKLNQP
ncbi:MAG: sensor histidine kinase [Candidatus Ratteibacteria bacterium]